MTKSNTKVEKLAFTKTSLNATRETQNDGKLVPAQTIEQWCKYSKTHVNREVNKNTTTTTTTTQQHQQPQKVGAVSPMPSCLGIGGHTGGSRQGHPRYTSASAEEGRGWPGKSMTTNTMRAETKNVHGHAMPRMPLAHLHGSGAVQDRHRQAREFYRVPTRKRTTRCRRSTEHREQQLNTAVTGSTAQRTKNCVVPSTSRLPRTPMSWSSPQEIPQQNTEKDWTSERDSENAELSTVEHQVKLNDMCVYQGRDQRRLSGRESRRGMQLRLHSQGDVTVSTQFEK